MTNKVSPAAVCLGLVVVVACSVRRSPKFETNDGCKIYAPATLILISWTAPNLPALRRSQGSH